MSLATERLEALVGDRFGLALPAALRAELPGLLAARLRASGLPDVERYLQALAGAPAVDAEWGALAAALTIGETHFFRTPDHWRALAERVLPEVRAAAGPDRPLRLLSAGCASGEEAWSLALVAAEAGAGPAEVLGVDCNPAAIARAREAWYPEWSLRGVDAATRARRFAAGPRGWRPRTDVPVAFEVRNLLADDPGFWRPGAFDVIMCRNVGIHLAPAAMQALVARLEAALTPAGWLFLAPAETLRGVSAGFEPVQVGEAFAYRRLGAPAPAAGAAAGDWAAAIQRASDRVTALTEGPPAAAAPTPDPAAEALAWRAFRAERFGDALAALPPGPRLLAAACKLGLGDLAGAQAEARALLVADPADAGAQLLLAIAHEQAGDPAAAHQAAARAAGLDAAFAMPWLQQGRLHAAAGDGVAARAAFARALALLPGEDEARLALFGGGYGRAALMAMARAALGQASGRGGAAEAGR